MANEYARRFSHDHFLGCLMGGAIGDALGAPIEFDSLDEVKRTYGSQGIASYVELTNGLAKVTDDTQMTLFTAEGLIRAIYRAASKGIWGAQSKIVYESYLRWYYTQEQQWLKTESAGDLHAGFLINERSLFARRAPGNTCLAALGSGKMGSIAHPVNNSKGCGGIMRMAPVGLLLHNEPARAFEFGCDFAAITHGHPTGYLSAGYFASLIAFLVQGMKLMEAIDNARILLKDHHQCAETDSAIKNAIELFSSGPPLPENIEKLGGAWVAEEALAISLYCSLHYESDFERGVLFAVNHSGDSDSTGAITGNILGIIHGASSIQTSLKSHIDLKRLIEEVAGDMYRIASEKLPDDVFRKYL